MTELKLTQAERTTADYVLRWAKAREWCAARGWTFRRGRDKIKGGAAWNAAG